MNILQEEADILLVLRFQEGVHPLNRQFDIRHDSFGPFAEPGRRGNRAVGLDPFRFVGSSRELNVLDPRDAAVLEAGHHVCLGWEILTEADCDQNRVQILRVDDDLSDLEEFILDEDFSDDDEFDFDEEDYYEIICPECGNIYITEFESFENNTVACPDCGAPFKLNEEVASCCGEDGCDCHQEI